MEKETFKYKTKLLNNMKKSGDLRSSCIFLNSLTLKSIIIIIYVVILELQQLLKLFT